MFLKENRLVRIGVSPLRIEVLTTISGVEFEVCYAEREIIIVSEDLTIPVISLAHLRQNKAASGRLKDLADLEALPASHPQP